MTYMRSQMPRTASFRQLALPLQHDAIPNMAPNQLG
jgi:hypothetical protein